MRIMSISGGKGGIGKTTISVNLAVAFAKMKNQVLLLDADLGLANVDVMLGLRPEKNLYDFLSGHCSLNEICIKGPHGLNIIPASSGIQKMADLSRHETIGLIQSFSSLTEKMDVMVVDLASGISSQVMDFAQASQDVIVVLCNDPSSLMDSYAVIKILHQQYARSRFGIIVNKVESSHEGFHVFSKFQQTIARFVNVNMNFLGHIPNDDYITIAARERVSVVDKFPQSKAALAFMNMCHVIHNWSDETSLVGGIHFFFDRLVQV
jgi:flagellar biosynthesis protein FlhG